jgi:hypothetical protein
MRLTGHHSKPDPEDAVEDTAIVRPRQWSALECEHHIKLGRSATGTCWSNMRLASSRSARGAAHDDSAPGIGTTPDLSGELFKRLPGIEAHSRALSQLVELAYDSTRLGHLR